MVQLSKCQRQNCAGAGSYSDHHKDGRCERGQGRLDRQHGSSGRGSTESQPLPWLPSQASIRRFDARMVRVGSAPRQGWPHEHSSGERCHPLPRGWLRSLRRCPEREVIVCLVRVAVTGACSRRMPSRMQCPRIVPAFDGVGS